MSFMNPDLPTVTVNLWRPDAVVLFDRLMSTDLNTVPITHPAQSRRWPTCSFDWNRRPTSCR
jgi:hypothetical protein